MRRALKFLIFIPAAILLLLLAVANRGEVVLSLDPLSSSEPAFFLKAPLFVYLFVALILGVILGGMSTWISQGRHRKAARQLRYETNRLKSDKAQSQPATATSPGTMTISQS